MWTSLQEESWIPMGVQDMHDNRGTKRFFRGLKTACLVRMQVRGSIEVLQVVLPGMIQENKGLKECVAVWDVI